MKIEDFYVGQQITTDLGGSGPSTVEVIDIDTKGCRLKVKHYTNKIDVWDKEFIEYVMLDNFK
jgi:hypothetical protein